MATVSRTQHNLPIEIIEKVIHTIWAEPLTNAERISFMTSSVLVNKTWSTLFSQVAFKDVHIPSLGYSKYFHDILDLRSNIFRSSTHAMPGDHCTTLTIQIESPRVPTTVSKDAQRYPDNSPSPFDLLDWLVDIPYLPHLRHLSIAYNNCDFMDIFDNMRFATFPKQITRLDVSYSFTTSTPDTVIDALQRQMPICPLEGLPLTHITHLSVYGAGIAPVLALLMLNCYGLQNVETDLRRLSTRSNEEREYADALQDICGERRLDLRILDI